LLPEFSGWFWGGVSGGRTPFSISKSAAILKIFVGNFLNENTILDFEIHRKY